MQLVRSVLVVVFFLFLLFALSKNIVDYRRNIKLHETLKKEYEDKKKDNIKLKTNVLRYNDPDELEKTIRNKLNMVKEDEVAVIIAKPSPVPFAPSPTPQQPYKQWFSFFGLTESD